MVTLGSVSRVAEKKDSTNERMEIPVEMLLEMAREEQYHIRTSIIDAGREELPNQLQQFTDLLNAAGQLASTTKQQQEATPADTSKLLLEGLGWILKTPELRDKVVEIIKSVGSKPKTASQPQPQQ